MSVFLWDFHHINDQTLITQDLSLTNRSSSSDGAVYNVHYLKVSSDIKQFGRLWDIGVCHEGKHCYRQKYKRKLDLLAEARGKLCFQ